MIFNYLTHVFYFRYEIKRGNILALTKAFFGMHVRMLPDGVCFKMHSVFI